MTKDEFYRSLIDNDFPTDRAEEGYAKLQRQGWLSAADYLELCGWDWPGPLYSDDKGWLNDLNDEHLNFSIKEDKMKKKIYELLLPYSKEQAEELIELITEVIDKHDIYCRDVDDNSLYCNTCKVRVTDDEWEELRFKLNLDKSELWW